MPKPLQTAVLALALCVATGAAHAQIAAGKPKGIEGVGVDEKLGEQIPLDLTFRDENGRKIKLANLFNGDRPVLLSLNYSNCPMLCRWQLTGLLDTLKEMEWTTGKQFHVVSVSIDPLETPKQAKKTEENYLGKYGRDDAAGGWHFLTGNEPSIAKLADSVGFRFKFLRERNEYSHAAAVMVCTPKGVVSRYLYGVQFDPQTVRLSLVEAGEGQIGSPMDQILLFCFHYDATNGRYGPVARNIMSAGAAATVLTLGACLLPFWVRRKRNQDQGDNTDTISPDPDDSPQPLAT